MRPITRYAIALPTAIGLGLASVFLAVVILQIPPNRESNFPFIFAEFSWLTLILLFASGIMLGLIFSIKSHHPLIFGFATMAAFPVLAFADMAQNPYTHNLWPIEFVMYGLVSLLAVGGAYAGRALLQAADRRGRS